MLKKFALSLFAGVALLLLAGPWVLYWVGLHGVKGTPETPKLLAPREQQLEVWRLARGSTEPTVVVLNPYTYLPLAYRTGEHKPALLLAWWVASDFNLQHHRDQGMLWWHLSGAALTIWLTRNWSIEQLLTKAVEGRGKSAA